MGLVLIGRYNTNYVLFPLVFATLLLLEVVPTLTDGQNGRKLLRYGGGLLLVLLVVFQSINLYDNLAKQPVHDYTAYLAEISAAIPPDARTLANLNSNFHFEDEALLDYRNLSHLPEEVSLTDYFTQNEIEYVVLSEEMAYIARNPDPWHILYGRLDYYPELIQLLESEFELIHQFESPGYGMRIIPYLDGYPWEVRIYKKKGLD